MNEKERAIHAIERRIKKAEEKRANLRARKDFKLFAPRVLRDEQTAKPIELAPIHELAIDFFEYCMRIGKFPAIIFPVEHGKSSLFAVGLPLYRWGQDRSETLKLVSASKDIIQTRVKQSRGYISGKHDNAYNRICPDVKPDKEEGWRTDQIHIIRDVAAFPSLWAHPVLGAAEGGRCGGLILDDVVSRANSIQKNLCQDVIDACEDSWLKRVHAGGWAMLLNTPWTTNDYVAHITKSRLGQWAVLKVPVNKTLDGYDVLVLGLDGWDHPKRLPLWNRFSKEYFLKKIEGEGIRAFRRNFQLDPYSEDERKLPHFDQAVKNGAGITVESILARWPRCARFTGIDPGGDKRPGTAIITLGISPDTYQRFPLSVRFGQWGPKRVAEETIREQLKWNSHVINFENNSLQEAFIDLVRMIPNSPVMPIRGFQTGKQKSDPEIGIEGLDIEFERGYWIIPSAEFEDHEVGCTCGWCRWVAEILNYPNYDTSDGLMATWFAWNAARVGGTGRDYASSAGEREALAG